jgi:hypothetical protein
MNLLVEYCRLSTTGTFLRPILHHRSSVDRLGPIRDARPEDFTDMHAIGGAFGQNSPGTDAGKDEWLIR